MRIRVTEVRRRQAGRVFVAFRSEVGEGVGLWLGAVDPALGEYDVELSPPPLEWGATARLSRGEAPRISAIGDGCDIHGRLEDESSDGAAVLRVGPLMVMFTATGQAPPAGAWVHLSCDRVEIIPYEL